MEALLKREIIHSRTAEKALLAGACVIMMALSAFVRIPLPFTPVPVTLQTMVVLCAAAVLGRNTGVAAQLGYIGLGAAGMPLFTNAGSGLLYLVGPTAGYLWGFIAATMVLAALLPREKASPLYSLACFIAADAVIFLCGIAWLKCLVGGPWHTVLVLGVVPFIPGEAAKVGAAWLLYNGALKYRRQG